MKYLNDSPIATKDDDAYGIYPFAQSLAKSILSINKPIGTTIAIHGPWGSGKSSAVNLLRHELSESCDETLVVTDFKCWWYRGEDALALAFLQNLHAVLLDKLGNKVKELIPKLGHGLLQAGQVIGPAVALASTSGLGALASGFTGFTKSFFPKGDTVEATYRKLAKALENQDRRFLVIIDDLDRLNPDEALSIFRLVKSVGHLPNVMYLLVFDRSLAEKAVQEKYPSEGPHFLEKIIQAGFELPAPLPADLNNAVLTAVERICGVPDESQITRIMNNYYDIVAPYIATPRHVARLQNAISVTWPAIAGQVSLADFIGLEAIRLYEPNLFSAIRSNKSRVCGIGQMDDRSQRDDSRFDVFLSGIASDRHDTVRNALQRLFPRLAPVFFSSDQSWDAERRVCIEKHFDTYFRLCLSEETLPSEVIAELVDRADDRDFVQSTMKAAANVNRKDGTSLIPVYLDELTVNARKVEKDKVAPLMTALFEIHDEIDLERDKDRGFYATANTSLRYHWLIRRLTADRFTINERTDLYRKVAPSASLGWLVDFVSSAKNDYREREEGPKRAEDCLMAEDAIPELVGRALEHIRAAAADGILTNHPDLVYILYRWCDFNDGDPSEVREWTTSLMDDNHSVVALAADFTGESWSHGMGGFGFLGDRVATRNIRANISDNMDIIDAALFRERLEQLRDSDTLSEESCEIVTTLLDAWDRKRAGKED